MYGFKDTIPRWTLRQTLEVVTTKIRLNSFCFPPANCPPWNHGGEWWTLPQLQVLQPRGDGSENIIPTPVHKN